MASEQREVTGKPGNGYGSQFDFKKAEVRVNEKLGLAAVSVPALDTKRSVAAGFTVNLREDKVASYRHQVIVPNEDGELEVKSYYNGKSVQPNHQLVVGSDYVIDGDNQRMSYQQFKDKYNIPDRGAQGAAQPQTQSADQIVQVTDICSDCESDATDFCNVATILYCGAVGFILGSGLGGVAAGIICSIYLYFSDGCASFATASCADECSGGGYYYGYYGYYYGYYGYYYYY